MQLEGRIFITGGSGFLARGIYRRAIREKWDAEFTCFSRDDAKHATILQRFPNVSVIRGSVTHDIDYLAAAMRGHDIVIHAAAAKFVDLSEFSAVDTIKVNVYGSMNVALAAVQARVKTAIAISTDKACAPVNIYGASKFAMERIWQDFGNLGSDDDPRFIGVRYGNVIGSTGSVIPLFRKQVKEYGHVRITDPDMTRFWMSVDEAVSLILLAHGRAQSGSIAIPRPAAANISTVAHAAVGSRQMEIVGTRPGEKKHEDLLHLAESLRTIPYVDWYELRPPGETRAQDPFRVTSEHPDRWLSAGDLAHLIHDAEDV